MVAVKSINAWIITHQCGLMCITCSFILTKVIDSHFQSSEGIMQTRIRFTDNVSLEIQIQCKSFYPWLKLKPRECCKIFQMVWKNCGLRACQIWEAFGNLKSNFREIYLFNKLPVQNAGELGPGVNGIAWNLDFSNIAIDMVWSKINFDSVKFWKYIHFI